MGGFVKIDQQQSRALMDLNLGSMERRIMDWALSILRWDNTFDLHQATFADKFNVSRQSVNRAMKNLKTKNVLRVVSKTEHMLNPKIFHRVKSSEVMALGQTYEGLN